MWVKESVDRGKKQGSPGPVAVSKIDCRAALSWERLLKQIEVLTDS